ncbi:hypothetical protein F5146DRAFT_1144828 [Armillaria mellea]|nr:hypothetical protein F5146DRAFT_1144828 [Armillaria mellea]
MGGAQVYRMTAFSSFPSISILLVTSTTKSETPRSIDLDDDDDGLVNSKMGSSASALQDDGSAAEEGNASDAKPQ